MRETPLADRIPLWRTLHEDGVTALVTPALDYVGGLALRGLDTRFLKDDEAAQLGEGLRDLLAGLEEEVTLHFLYRVHEDVDEDLRAYRSSVVTDARPGRGGPRRRQARLAPPPAAGSLRALLLLLPRRRKRAARPRRPRRAAPLQGRPPPLEGGPRRPAEGPGRPAGSAPRPPLRPRHRRPGALPSGRPGPPLRAPEPRPGPIRGAAGPGRARRQPLEPAPREGRGPPRPRVHGGRVPLLRVPRRGPRALPAGRPGPTGLHVEGLAREPDPALPRPGAPGPRPSAVGRALRLHALGLGPHQAPGSGQVLPQPAAQARLRAPERRHARRRATTPAGASTTRTRKGPSSASSPS